MRLLQRHSDGRLKLTNDLTGNDAIPPYAILSHTWGLDEEEVTFFEFKYNQGREKAGYRKIQYCADQARRDGLEYFWVDSCCIDKENVAEFDLAINSMFRWYRNASRCYVYLSDVSSYSMEGDEIDIDLPCAVSFQRSRWFRRGWTLQELLAPNSVEFFSKEWERLGDRTSLEQYIYQATGIPHSVLQGKPLHEFSVNQRLSWSKHRKTKREEDKAYSLQGIFNVQISALYGEGAAGAFKRLMQEIEKSEACVRDLRCTDPRDDMERIESTKGGLVKNSFEWVLEHTAYEKWRVDRQSKLLWIKGDPGKGKTMLVCGITKTLRKAPPGLISFFFCQGTDSRINSATSVLRGLLYLIVTQRPSLTLYLRKKYDEVGSSMFHDANAWLTLCTIFKDIAHNYDLEDIYLIIDGLDECFTDLPKLLELIIQTSKLPSRIKWLLSSRNELHIEQRLNTISDDSRLSLELKQNAEHVSHAVDLYISERLSSLTTLQDNKIRAKIERMLRQKAHGTFLWVALVISELENPETLDPLEVVENVSPGLSQLYNRMIQQIHRLSETNLNKCFLLLSTATMAYRPLDLLELGSLCGLQGKDSALKHTTSQAIAMCGSFLTIRENKVFLIHQSAKDYLLCIFPSKAEISLNIFRRSIELMSLSLKRDLYTLDSPAVSIHEIKKPTQDPLIPLGYACIYWIDHLHDWMQCISLDTSDMDIADTCISLKGFLENKFLYWIEALSLCLLIPEGILAIVKLETLINSHHGLSELNDLVHDAYRFIMNHKEAVETYPIQVYISALLFSPKNSLIRHTYRHEEPDGIFIKSGLDRAWGACLQKLKGHASSIECLTASHDCTLIATGSYDGFVKIWNVTNGVCLNTFEVGLSISCLAFSTHELDRLAVGTGNDEVRIFDINSELCVQTLSAGSVMEVTSVAFSLHDSNLLASGHWHGTVRIWNIDKGTCEQVLPGPDSKVDSMAFSPHDSKRFASSSRGHNVHIWDLETGACIRSLPMDGIPTTLFGFSPESPTWLGTFQSEKGVVEIWDIDDGSCLETHTRHGEHVHSASFTHNSILFASSPPQAPYCITLWDSSRSDCVITIDETNKISLMTLLSTPARVASVSYDNVVTIWDAGSTGGAQIVERHKDAVRFVGLSPCNTCLASLSYDGMVKLWDTSNGNCLRTLITHGTGGDIVVFSTDMRWVASTAEDAIDIWDLNTGLICTTLWSGNGSPTSESMSFSDKFIASGLGDGYIKVWYAQSWDLAMLAQHSPTHQASSSKFTHDSAFLATGSEDGTIKLWNTSDWTCCKTLSIPYRLDRFVSTKDGLILHTSSGGMTLIDSSGNIQGTSYNDHKPPLPYIGLSKPLDWITLGESRILWLAPEYRSSIGASFEGTIAVGCLNRRVLLCTISPDNAISRRYPQPYSQPYIRLYCRK